MVAESTKGIRCQIFAFCLEYRGRQVPSFLILEKKEKYITNVCLKMINKTSNSQTKYFVLLVWHIYLKNNKISIDLCAFIIMKQFLNGCESAKGRTI